MRRWLRRSPGSEIPGVETDALANRGPRKGCCEQEWNPAGESPAQVRSSVRFGSECRSGRRPTDMDDKIEDLHDRVQRGAYRALPSRRVYIG
jgi:hypothetical protein